MKAILEFNLPEDQSEFENASRAGDVFLALWDLDMELRNMVKHGLYERHFDGSQEDPKVVFKNEHTIAAAIAMTARIREILLQSLVEYKINLNQ